MRIFSIFRPASKAPSVRFYVPDGNSHTRFTALLKTCHKTAKLVSNDVRSSNFISIDLKPFLEGKETNPFTHGSIVHYSQGYNILLDISAEPLVFNDGFAYSAQMRKLHDIIAQKKLDNNRIYILHANSSPDNGYENWCAANSISNPLNIRGFDIYPYESSIAVNKYFRKEKLMDDITDNSFIRPARKYIFSAVNPAEIKQIAQNISNDTMLVEGHYDVFGLAHKDWANFLMLNEGTRRLLESYIDIVSEPFFTDGSCRFFTEKTMRAFLSFKPFIIVGSPFSLQKLREMGFRTFPTLINEEYDNITSPQERMKFIASEMERISQLSRSEIAKTYFMMQETLFHNYYLALKKLRPSVEMVESMFLSA